MSWKKYCENIGVKPIYSERFSSSCLYEEHIPVVKKVLSAGQGYSINMLYNRHKEDKYKNKFDALCLHDTAEKRVPIVIKEKKNNKYKRQYKHNIYVDDTLDFHGMGLIEAYDAFLVFIQNAFIKQYTIVLVITGKGIDNQGRIKKSFYYWIEYMEIREMILSCEQYGDNDGAFYINIKKNTSL